MPPTIGHPKFPYCIHPLLENNHNHCVIVRVTDSDNRRVQILFHPCRSQASPFPWGQVHYLSPPWAQHMRVTYIDCSPQIDAQEILSTLNKTGQICRCELKDRVHELEIDHRFCMMFSYGPNGIEQAR